MQEIARKLAQQLMRLFFSHIIHLSAMRTKIICSGIERMIAV
jgi:hypothetical protein